MKVGVVGAGISGLGVSALLAGDHDVTLWDALPRVGGVAAGCDLDDVAFSPGPQFFWGFGPGGAGTRILSRMGVTLPMRALPVSFDQLSLGRGGYQDVVAGTCGPLLDEVIRDHPTQRAPIAAFLSALDAIGEACVALSAGASFADSGAAMLTKLSTSSELGLRARALVLRHHRASVAGFARKQRVHPAAVRIVAYQQGIFAERLEDLSLVLFAAARHHLKQPLAIPEGGALQLPNALGERVRARGGEIALAHEVIAVRREGRQWAVTSRRDGAGRERTDTVDRLVFACAPQVAARVMPGVTTRSEPGHCVTALCLSIVAEPAVLAGLAERNFTWYRGAQDDVAFDPNVARVDYVNFTSPTLNGGASPTDLGGSPVIVVAFYPGGSEHPESAAEAEGVVLALLRQWGRVEVRARRVIGRRQWRDEFGSHQGAIYGRRLTSSSIRGSSQRGRGKEGLPPGVAVAHSSVGIPGVIGCLELAERTADELVAGAS